MVTHAQAVDIRPLYYDKSNYQHDSLTLSCPVTSYGAGWGKYRLLKLHITKHSSLVIIHCLLGTGSTLTLSYSSLRAEILFQKICHFQILQSEMKHTSC